MILEEPFCGYFQRKKFEKGKAKCMTMKTTQNDKFFISLLFCRRFSCFFGVFDLLEISEKTQR